MVVYTWKGTFFLQMLVNTSEHMSVEDLLSRISQPIFFDSSSGVTIAKPVHKMHNSVFFLGKWHVYNYCSVHSYHSMK
jgi:hypothetical protein